MKKLSLWTARLFAFALLLVAAGSGRAVAQSEMTDGYYYWWRTAGNGLYLSYSANDNLSWRLKESAYEPATIPTTTDLAYIFKFTKNTESGNWSIKNVASGQSVGRDSSEGYGAGLGLKGEAHEYALAYDEGVGAWTMNDASDSYDTFVVMSWLDGYASYNYSWNTTSDNMKYWNFTKVADALVENAQTPEVVEGDLADGYYLIQLPNYSDGNVYMCAALDENSEYRLAADMIEDMNDYDNAFIFHVTKLDNGNYRIKNCGSQNNTYIYPYITGDHATSYVFMSGNKQLENKIELLSTGNAYVYSADQNYCYYLDTSTGFMTTSSTQNSVSTWKFVAVDDSKITPELKLTEAITDAKGGNYVAGDQPGCVPQDALTAFEAVITAAEAEAAGTDHTATIENVNAAVETIEAAKIQLSDGYYRFINKSTGDYLIPNYNTYNSETRWFFGHGTIDETDPASYWHITTDADGNRVMKNAGTQNSTYIKAITEGDAWCRIYLTGTSQTTQTFKQVEGNTWQIFSSDNSHPMINGDSGFNTCNWNYYESLSMYWNVEKVADEEITVLTKLNEAITDAQGLIYDTNVGTSPGLNKGDTTALAAAIESARTMYNEGTASDAEIDAMITTLKTAGEEFAAQDHSMNTISDGYYYIINSKADANNSSNELAMYTTENSELKWKRFEDKNPEFLFHITDNGDSTYTVQNVKYLNYVGAYSTSSESVLMTATAETAQTFTYLGNFAQWNMSNTTDQTAYFAYGQNMYMTAAEVRLQAGNVNTTSAWYLRQITDEALIDSMKNAGAQASITQAMKNALVIAEPAYKNVMKYNVNYNEGLITEVNESDPLSGQVYGTQVNDTYTSYAHLIDGDLSSCFQSTWNKVDEQFLQVDLRSNAVDNFEFYFGLRDGMWGYYEMWTDFTLYATNDADIVSDATVDTTKWNYIGRYTDISTDYEVSGSGRSFYYRITGMDQPYRYLRFVVNSTAVPQNNGMFTIGEFQVYKATIDEENSPYSYVPGLKDAADNLKALIDNAQAKVESNSATTEEVNALLAAAQAVIDLTPNTTDLDALITEVSNYIANFGTDDEWGDVTTEQENAILEALDNAQDYDPDQPLPDDLASRKAALETAFAQYKSSQKQFDTNTWYYIVNRDTERAGYIDEGGTSSSIYSTWVYGHVIIAPSSNNTRAMRWKNTEDALYWGYYTRSTGERDADSYTDPYCMWRLVDITEDGAEDKVYALQNRATGQYMGVAANHNGRYGMSATPVPYYANLLASGQYGFVCADATNTDKRPIHASGDGYMCTWEGTANSPSSWYLEPVADDIENLYIKLADNSIQIMSLPFAIDAASSELNISAGISTYVIAGISEDYTQLYLKSQETFEAGEPFIVIANDYKSYDAASTATVQFAMPLANEFTLEGKSENGLTAVMDYTVPGSGYGIFSASAVDTTTTETGLNGHSGYIDPSAISVGTAVADLTVIEIPEGLFAKKEIVNNINTVVTTKAAYVNVYTTDGVLVKKNVARANATDGLKAGIYIVGKEKVLVK